MSRNLGALTLLDPSGPAWPVMGVLYLYFCLLVATGNVLTREEIYGSKETSWEELNNNSSTKETV
jgi:hypothetical protein